MPYKRTGRTGQLSSSLRAPRSVGRQRPRPKWARRTTPTPTIQPSRDWIQISITALPGLAAVIALIFTSLAIRATDAQLQIAEQGQITDRYNAAITNLGSPSVDVRLGGIYALQRIMQDSSRDQPVIVAVLCAYVRDHANAATLKIPHVKPSLNIWPVPMQLPTDIQAALTVVGSRNTAHDGSTTVVDLTNVDLSGMNLNGESLSGANLSGANLSGASLSGANLSRANLAYTNLDHVSEVGSPGSTGADLAYANFIGASFDNADLSGANLTSANLIDADLSRAILDGADLSGAQFDNAVLTRANLSGANLSGASLPGANLTRADLSVANFTGAFLPGVNLMHADFTRANLSDAFFAYADFTRADLSGADFSGVKLTHVKGLRTATQTP